ncbi:uncharacterized protein [Henckelia pumila]|uniref:uncharacterized protein isoform X1 n=1 Tax=Henckelia pumila TaxID=405737 RepID=UPI003C6E609D
MTSGEELSKNQAAQKLDQITRGREERIAYKDAGFLSLSYGETMNYIDSSKISWAPDVDYVASENCTSVVFLEGHLRLVSLSDFSQILKSESVIGFR